MSCWVAPSLAAELWHVPLEQVMRLVREGQLAVKEDGGFTFVDVAPAAPRFQPKLCRPEDRPAMFTPVSDEEVAALTEDAAVDETESASLGDWRTARQKAGRMRIAPRRLSA